MFWADHGETIFRAAYLLSLVIGFGLLIFRQGRHFGRDEESKSKLNDKVDKNCAAIKALRDTYNKERRYHAEKYEALKQRVEDELHRIERERFVTHNEHAEISSDCKGSIEKSMDGHKKEVDRRFGEYGKAVEEIKKELRDNNKSTSQKLDSIQGLVQTLHLKINAKPA